MRCENLGRRAWFGRRALGWDQEQRSAARVPPSQPCDMMAKVDGRWHRKRGPSAEFAHEAGKDHQKKSEQADRGESRRSMLGAEAIWLGATPALLLTMPGAGIWARPPVRGSGTPEQKEAILRRPSEDMSRELRWGAYAIDRAGRGKRRRRHPHQTCRKDGDHWVHERPQVLHHQRRARGVGGRSSPPIDPTLGRAGHRAFVVEKGTPGFSVGRIEAKMGLRASETAELVLGRLPGASTSQSFGRRRKATSRKKAS